MGAAPSWLHPSQGHDLRGPQRPDPPRAWSEQSGTKHACEDVAMIEIGPLRPADRDAWEVLARGYKAFYRDPMPDEAYEVTWQRLAAGTELHGLGARLDGRLVGIAHYFFHPAFWSGEACYLQDLFVDDAVRGH